MAEHMRPLLQRTARQGERGAGLILALAFLVLVVPIVTSALALGSTLATDSNVKTRMAKSDYGVTGGVQHGIYRIAHETGYADSLAVGLPDSYALSLNGQSVAMTVTRVTGPAFPPEPIGLKNQAFSISKIVAPQTATPGVSTTYVYTVMLTNNAPTEKQITHVRDTFPAALTYVAGSTTGITTDDPTLVSGDLSWSLSGGQGTIAAGASATLQFQMEGTLSAGVHCNDVWVSPGGDKTRSGPTAKITAGTPGSSGCSGLAVLLSKSVTPEVAAAGVTTTFTYAITLQNDGSVVAEITKIIDLLPPGFDYVLGSSQGAETADPSIVLKNNGTQEQLTWDDGGTSLEIPFGESRTLTFQVVANVAGGDYFNEATVTVNGQNYDLYTWPTARVHVSQAFRVVAAGPESTAEAELWLNEDGSTTLTKWNLGAR